MTVPGPRERAVRPGLPAILPPGADPDWLVVVCDPAAERAVGGGEPIAVGPRGRRFRRTDDGWVPR